jgi:hypothetical protein
VNGRRLLLIVVACVTAWYAVTFVAWALQPQNDSVPLGVDYSLTSPKPVTDTVECNTLFESSPRDGTAGPPPTFAPQPGNAPELAYEREPCAAVHRQARGLFIANTALLVVVWILAGVLWTRVVRPRRGAVTGSLVPT